MKGFLDILSRFVPALASSLVTYGVTQSHAEAIVLGAIALAYTVTELTARAQARAKKGES